MGSTSRLRTSVRQGEFVQPERAIPHPSEVAVASTGRRHATEPLTEAEKLTIPVVRLGQAVLWYANGDKSSTPHNAHVAAIERTQLTLDVQQVGGVVKRIRNVRHIDDPMARSPRMRQFGGWDVVVTPTDERVQELSATIEELLQAIGELTERVSTLEAANAARAAAAKARKEQPAQQ